MPSAVVFGARNLGGAIARGLLADGYQVASVARTKADLDRLAAQGAFPVSADVTDPDALAGAVTRAAERPSGRWTCSSTPSRCGRRTTVVRLGAEQSRRHRRSRFSRVGAPSAEASVPVSLSGRPRARGPQRDARAGYGRAGPAGGGTTRPGRGRARRRACARPCGRTRAARGPHSGEVADRRRDHRVAEDDADDRWDVARRAGVPGRRRGGGSVSRHAVGTGRQPPVCAHAVGEPLGAVTIRCPLRSCRIFSVRS